MNLQGRVAHSRLCGETTSTRATSTWRTVHAGARAPRTPLVWLRSPRFFTPTVLRGRGRIFPAPAREPRSEAAFAALGGTSPVPASSGQTVRHRLNRGGDRALNRAIHAIALVRMRSCPHTRAYAARRTAEGKTAREIRRCLKRYIARELYRQLTRTMNLPEAP
jgi:Transposase IS116/IS110/IS902 family